MIFYLCATGIVCTTVAYTIYKAWHRNIVLHKHDLHKMQLDLKNSLDFDMNEVKQKIVENIQHILDDFHRDHYDRAK